MSIGILERSGTHSGGHDEYSSEQAPKLNTDGAGSMRGDGNNDDDKGGGGSCVRKEFTDRYNTADLQGVTVEELIEGNDLREGDFRRTQIVCGKSGCQLTLVLDPSHGVFQTRACKE